MVLPASRRISRVRRYSSKLPGSLSLSSTRLSPSVVALSRDIRLGFAFNPAHRCIDETELLTTPDEQRIQSYTRLVWALPVSLAATQGITFVFFSSGYLDGSVLLVSLSFQSDWTLLQPGSPIRTSSDQSLFAAPRSISLLTTSFIAFPCQVIHQKPLVA